MDKKIIIILSISAFVIILGLLIFQLITSPGRLILKINPEDAVVFIDGKYEKYRLLKIKKGNHNLSINKGGYETINKDIKVKYFGTTTLEYVLKESEKIISGLPYGDIGNNFFIYGYYGDDYKPIYNINTFSDAGEGLGKEYLKKKGVNLEKVKIIVSPEYDKTGESAPN